MFFQKIRDRWLLQETQLELALDRIALLQAQMHEVQSYDCEVCGCMVRKQKAVEGELKIGEETMYEGLISGLKVNRPYIYTPRYCRRCAPQKRK